MHTPIYTMTHTHTSADIAHMWLSGGCVWQTQLVICLISFVFFHLSLSLTHIRDYNGFIGLFLPHTAFFSSVSPSTRANSCCRRYDSVWVLRCDRVELYIYIRLMTIFARCPAPTNGICVRLFRCFLSYCWVACFFTVLFFYRLTPSLFFYFSNRSHSFLRVVVTVAAYKLCRLLSVLLFILIALITSPLSSNEFSIDILFFICVLSDTGTSYIAPADPPSSFYCLLFVFSLRLLLNPPPSPLSLGAVPDRVTFYDVGMDMHISPCHQIYIYVSLKWITTVLMS